MFESQPDSNKSHYMPIDKVSLQKTYSIGPYLTSKIGVEMSLGENQDPKQALSEMEKLCDEYNAQANVHLQSDISCPQPPEPPILPIIERDRMGINESLVDAINKCHTWAGYNGLNTYAIVKKNKEEQEAFDRRKKELGVIA